MSNITLTWRSFINVKSRPSASCGTASLIFCICIFKIYFCLFNIAKQYTCIDNLLSVCLLFDESCADSSNNTVTATQCQLWLVSYWWELDYVWWSAVLWLLHVSFVFGISQRKSHIHFFTQGFILCPLLFAYKRHLKTLISLLFLLG